MPGVYVYKIGQLDWPEQQKEPILTVPGSYWLCHKNNIYKFTFRYHRVVRNAKKFAYGKELMKVVRRIIKSQPRQGQQFCTKHILVTYNHTSWTRQDKMFAMLKFREHTEAAIVTRAIMLTVKLIENENSVSNDVVFYTKTEPETIESLIDMKKDYSSKDIENDNAIDLENSNDELKMNIEDSDKRVSNLNLDCDSSNSSCSSTTDDFDTINKCQIAKHSKKSFINRFANAKKKNTHKNENYATSFKEERTEQNKCYNYIEKSSLSNQFEFKEITEQEKKKIQVNGNTADDINSISEEGVIDSANLPYQYLIEKEIENAKKKVVRVPLQGVNKSICIHVKHDSNANSITKSKTKNSKKIKKENNQRDINCTKQAVYITAQNSIEEHKKDVKCISLNSKEYENNHNKASKTHYSQCKNTDELQKKIVSDENASKSSNITDLIMKGCMFTIQQDKDSISVLEQKTKSDVDEVLENSEKVETKEGEKCLLNSSLLKLENLVTMIEAPKENITYDYKSKIAIGNNVPLHSTLMTKDYITSQHMIERTTVIVPSTPSLNSQNKPILNQLFDKTIVQDNKPELDTIDCKDQKQTRGSLYLDTDVEDENINNKSTVRYNTITKCTTNVVENSKAVEKSITSEMQECNNESKNSMTEPLNSCKTFYSKDTITSNTEVVLTPDNAHSIESKENILQTNSSLHSNETVSGNSINNSNYKIAETTPNTTSNHIFNTPRIISNQIITIDQMPLRLQNIVKKKLSRMNASTNKPYKPSVQKTQLCNESINLEERHLDTKSETNIVPNCTNTLSLYSDIKVTEETPTPYKKRNRSPEYNINNESDQWKVGNDEVISQEKICSPIDKIERPKKRRKEDSKYHPEKSIKVPAHISDIINRKYSTMPNKLQDITEEFYQDLMQHHKHNKTIDCKVRKQTRGSLYLDTDVEDENIRIEMLKFIDDITRGVKVVVKRMSRKSILSILEKSPSLTYIN